jgi:hypothetical protein
MCPKPSKADQNLLRNHIKLIPIPIWIFLVSNQKPKEIQNPYGRKLFEKLLCLLLNVFEAL